MIMECKFSMRYTNSSRVKILRIYLFTGLFGLVKTSPTIPYPKSHSLSILFSSYEMRER